MPRESIQTLSMITHNKTCLVPRRLSFDENVRAKEGGKETTGDCTLPMVPCGSSPVTRFALASRKTRRLTRRLINSLSYSYYCSFKHASARTANLPLVKSQNRLAVRVIFGIK